jgi:hypothetical protein
MEMSANKEASTLAASNCERLVAAKEASIRLVNKPAGLLASL